MNNMFANIYESLSLEKLPGIVSFEKSGRSLAQLRAANDIHFGGFAGALNYEESFGGGSLDGATETGHSEDTMAAGFERLEIFAL